MSDKPEELGELLDQIFKVHPSHSLEEITYHRNNGGLLALSCRIGRFECANILLKLGASKNE